MLKLIRTWLGLGPLDRDTHKLIDAANMRVALFVSFPLMVVHVYLISLTSRQITSSSFIGTRSNAQGAVWILRLSTVIVIAAALILFSCALAYRRGKVARHGLAVGGLGAHAILCAVAGIMVSMVDARIERGAYLLLAFLLGGLTVFSYHPLFSIGLMLGTFIMYATIGHAALAFTREPTLVSATFWFCLVLSSVFRYNAERHHADAELAATKASESDYLTGVGNRQALRARVERFEPGTPYIVAIMDIDDFKYYNDVHGHDAGDKVLVGYANALESCFGEHAVFRYGGDEFLAVCVELDEQVFLDKIKHFRHSIAGLRVTRGSLTVTTSLGYALGEAQDWHTFQEHLRKADERLFYAKRQGKNRTVGPTQDIVGPVAALRHGEHPIDPSIGRLHKLDDVDPLTKLCNINSFLRRCQILLDDEERIRSGLLIVYFNLEGFAGYNERYGFEAGDRLLCDVADLLSEHFPNHLIARVGADHFVVAVYPDMLAAQERPLYEEIRSLGGGVRIGLKIGICQPGPHEVLSASVACDRAQEAADSIKGRHDVIERVYDEELRQEIERRRYIVNNIEEALKQHKIEVYLQPIIRSLNGKICVMEALSRWNDETYGLISPGTYIGTLEECRLIHLHDLYMVEEVVSHIRSLKDRGIELLPISMNFSRVDFDIYDMPHEIGKIMDRYGVPRNVLCIEITESAFSGGGERLARMVEQFKAAGHEVWMDDFGTGYSSLNTLQNLDFDLVKLDMGFIRSLESSPNARVIVSSIVDMAKRLGMHTLAEGVETEEQFAFVRGIGCELVQGFLFSRPVEADSLEASILRGDSIPVERMEEHDYYARLGMVNPMSTTPLIFDHDLVGAAAEEILLPNLAYVELREGILHCIQASESFANMMQELGVGTYMDTGCGMGDSPASKSLHSLINVAKTSKEIESLELVHENTRYQVMARYVASMQGADAFVITASRSGSSIFSDASGSESVLIVDIFYSYDQVDLFDLETGSAQNLFRGNADYPYGYEGKDVQEMAERYVQENVHPDDREAFVEFENVSTAMQRLRQKHLNILTSAFRIKSQRDGTWRWKVFYLVPVTYGGRKCLLSSTRDVSLESVQRIMNAGW